MNLNKLVFSLAALCLVSCKGGSDRPEGHYEGAIYEKKSGTITQKAVSFDVTYSSKNEGKIDVSGTDKIVFLTLNLADIKPNSFSVQSGSPYAFQFDFTKNGDCFLQDFMGPGQHAQFCFTQDKVFFEVSDESDTPIFTLSGDRFGLPSNFSMEDPKDYALSDAIQIALKKNFDTRIEFEHLIQAKHTAKAAYLNLLPHLSFSSILGNIVPNTLSLLNTIGDLMPFLLPNRWAQAHASKEMALAEGDGMVLMRADLATQVEGLAYNLERDMETLEFYRTLQAKAKDAAQKVSELEAVKQMEAGSSDAITAMIYIMQLDMSGLALMIQEDRYVLSMALGFHNPEAVRSLNFDSEILPIDTARALETDGITQQALSRSFELRQMDHILEAAKHLKTAMFFSWLDPAGDPALSLGFGLGHQIAVGQSHIQELQIKREQLQQAIAQNVARSVAEFDMPLITLKAINENIALQERRWTRITAKIHPGTDLSTMDVEAILQDYLASGVRKATLTAGYRVARSKIDRLLLQGYYLNVQLHEERHPVVLPEEPSTDEVTLLGPAFMN